MFTVVITEKGGSQRTLEFDRPEITIGRVQGNDIILPKLKEFGHRVLIFTQMTHLMDIMQIYFDYKGIKHLRLDDSTKADDRGQRTSLFNEENS